MTAKTRRYSQADIIAWTFGSDIADVRDCAYQPTRYRAPNVYTVGNDYYAVHASKPRHGKDVGMVWKAAPESQQWAAQKVGKTLWVASGGSQ